MVKNLTTGEQQPVKTAEVAQAVRGFLKPEGDPTLWEEGERRRGSPGIPMDGGWGVDLTPSHPPG